MSSIIPYLLILYVLSKLHDRIKQTACIHINIGYIKVDGVSSVFCFIWGWEEPAWGLPFQFHGVFYVMISMKGP